LSSRELGKALEDYLEAIYILSRNNRVVRVTDIAHRLGVKKPSVVAALKKLKEQGLIEQEKYGFVELTPEGLSVARRVYSRHEVLLKFFRDVLGVPPDVAERDACLMEHYLSPESLEGIRRLVEKG